MCSKYYLFYFSLQCSSSSTNQSTPIHDLRIGQLRCPLGHLHNTSFLNAPSIFLSYNLLGKRKDLFVSLLINYACVYEKCKKKVKVVLVYAARVQRGSRFIALLILNLGARWRSVVSITSHSLYPRGKTWYPLNGWLDGPQNRSGRFGEQKSLLFPARIPTTDRLARRQVSVLITLDTCQKKIFTNVICSNTVIY